LNSDLKVDSKFLNILQDKLNFASSDDTDKDTNSENNNKAVAAVAVKPPS